MLHYTIQNMRITWSCLGLKIEGWRSEKNFFNPGLKFSRLWIEKVFSGPSIFNLQLWIEEGVPSLQPSIFNPGLKKFYPSLQSSIFNPNLLCVNVCKSGQTSLGEFSLSTKLHGLSSVYLPTTYLIIFIHDYTYTIHLHIIRIMHLHTYLYIYIYIHIHISYNTFIYTDHHIPSRNYCPNSFLKTHACLSLLQGNYHLYIYIYTAY